MLELDDTGRFEGGCFQESGPVPFDGGTATFTLRDPFPSGTCETFVIAVRDGEPVAVILAGYFPGEFLPEDFGALFAQAGVVGDIVPETTVATDIVLACTAPDGTRSEGSFRLLSAVASNGRQYLSIARGIPITVFDDCTAETTLPKGGRAPIWGVFTLIDTLYQDPLFQGVGSRAAFDLADTDRDANSFQVLFLHELDTPRPVAAPLPAAPTVPVYHFFTGVRTECDDGTVFQPDESFPNFTVADGGTCTSTATDAGDRVLVAQANAEPREAPHGMTVTWTADATVGVTMVQLLEGS